MPSCTAMKTNTNKQQRSVKLNTYSNYCAHVRLNCKCRIGVGLCAAAGLDYGRLFKIGLRADSDRSDLHCGIEPEDCERRAAAQIPLPRRERVGVDLAWIIPE